MKRIRTFMVHASATVLIVALAGCAGMRSVAPAPGLAAPQAAAFRFDDSEPLARATDFAPWADLLADNAAAEAGLEGCLADKAACATPGLLRYRRLVELARDLSPREQVMLVNEYFNTVTWTRDAPTATRIHGRNDVWLPLVQVVSTLRADCKGIAFSKYFTLRHLGWQPENLRIVMGWDNEQRDWHAVLAVRLDGSTYMLDTILGLQRPQAFGFMRMVYSISEVGIWDHAPDYSPVQ
ncbi:MAG: transglutaminase-like cysteine peptidase [Telluria sp.]